MQCAECGEEADDLVRVKEGGKTRKLCEDCHVSDANDNNAWMAQLLLLGTNTVGFMGYYAYVGTGHDGWEAVRVTEWTEWVIPLQAFSDQGVNLTRVNAVTLGLLWSSHDLLDARIEVALELVHLLDR